MCVVYSVLYLISHIYTVPMESVPFLAAHPLWAAALACTAYVLGLIAYRLWLSPLAKFPGPKLAALTGWYEIYFDAVLHGKYTFEIGRMHKKYGLLRPPLSPTALQPREKDTFRRRKRKERYAQNADACMQGPLSESVPGSCTSTTPTFTKCYTRATVPATSINYMPTCLGTTRRRLRAWTIPITVSCDRI